MFTTDEISRTLDPVIGHRTPAFSWDGTDASIRREK